MEKENNGPAHVPSKSHKTLALRTWGKKRAQSFDKKLLAEAGHVRRSGKDEDMRKGLDQVTVSGSKRPPSFRRGKKKKNAGLGGGNFFGRIVFKLEVESFTSERILSN